MGELFYIAFQSVFFLVFFIILAMIIIRAINGIVQWNKNNNSPKLTVDATLVTKRIDVSTHNHNSHTTRHTNYYATFQVQSGDRMEFLINGNEYGMLVEGDYGKLSFQGTRYLSFERHKSATL